VSDLWISVVIPTYNRRESLRVTLDGLGRQTLPSSEFEVIVVSDGSTDGTDEFLAEYARTAPYTLRAICQSNAGPARARNRGMNEAHGEVIVLIDDDVEPCPEFLVAHARSHARNPTAAPAGKRAVGGVAIADPEPEKFVIIGPMLRDPKRREPAWIAWEHAMLQKQYDNWESGVWAGAGPMHFYSGNASFRREWALAVGGFNEDLKRAEDVDLGWRMQRECGVRFRFDSAPIGVHRPSRSFQSWLNVADAYGHLDVVRARAGDNSWDLVRSSYVSRNAITRLLAEIIFAVPPASILIRNTFLMFARAVFAAGARSTAIAALSVIYNLRYLESVRLEMGLPALRRLIANPVR
jgi:glycosyltransferase involved in cell wall biosynthesis